MYVNALGANPLYQFSHSEWNSQNSITPYSKTTSSNLPPFQAIPHSSIPAGPATIHGAIASWPFQAIPHSSIPAGPATIHGAIDSWPFQAIPHSSIPAGPATIHGSIASWSACQSGSNSFNTPDPRYISSLDSYTVSTVKEPNTYCSQSSPTMTQLTQLFADTLLTTEAPTLLQETLHIKSNKGVIIKKDRSSPDNMTSIKGRLDDQSEPIYLLNSLDFEQKELLKKDFRIENRGSIDSFFFDETKKKWLLAKDNHNFNSLIKFGLIKSDGKREIVAIKKYHSNNNPTYLLDGLILEACLQRRASLIDPANPIAPTVYAIAETSNPETKITKLYLAMSLSQGETIDKAIASLTPAEKISVLLDLARKVKQLHNNSIYHGDLKYTNVLLERSSLQTRIIDYELSHDLRTEIFIDFNPNEIKHYHAPEIYLASIDSIQQQKDRGKLNNPIKADIFSLGRLFTHALGKTPVIKHLYCTYKDDPPHRLANYNHFILSTAGISSQKLSTLVEKMMSPSAEDRPSMDDVIQALEQEYQQACQITQ